VQLQNLPRGKIVKDVMAAIEAVLLNTPLDQIEKSFGPPMVVFSELVRPLIVAKRTDWLARGDYSQIEARVLPWLAAEQTDLDAFAAYDRGEGPDIYIVTAAAMNRVDPSEIGKDDPRRQTGKVTKLACVFGGGKGALFAMAKIYGLKLTEEQAEAAVLQFRESSPNTKQWWYDLDNTAIKCLSMPPGQTFRVGKTGLISFRRNDTCLAMILPSGRRLIYWYARLEEVDTPWGVKKWAVTYYGEDSQKKIWRRFTAWYGIWAENATQAVARDVMAYALVLCERRGMRPVLTVHDEAVVQLAKRQYPLARFAAEAVLDVMLERPPWTIGLPIAAEASADTRYTKGSKENTISGYTRK
jgi:DNA polymerase